MPAWEGGVPPHELRVEFPFGYIVKPNDTTTLGEVYVFEVWSHFINNSHTGLMKHRPRLSWPADPKKLYTVMFFDHGKLNVKQTKSPLSLSGTSSIL